MLKITHEQYIKSDLTIEGGAETRQPEEQVSAEFVRNFLGAKGFFESLGGTEEHKKLSGGRIMVTATRPDGGEVRKTLFTPVREG